MDNPSFTARIVSVTRLNVSINANPRFRVEFDNETELVTQSDASVNYGIENVELRNVPVDVWLTRNGRIHHMQPHSL